METTNTGLLRKIWEEIRKGYHFIFIQDMPLWAAGIGRGILAILIFLWRYPWGISSGYGNRGNQMYYYLGLGKLAGLKEAPLAPWIHPVSVMNLGMIFGSMGAAMMKKQFTTYLAPGRKYVKGFLGGALMGIGSSFANGCIEGGFYTAVGGFSLGGFAMMIGLGMVIAGACASSGLWRAGEGNTKIWLAIVGFCSVYPPFKFAVQNTALGPFLGKGIYVVDIFTWTWTPILYLAFFIVWYVLAAYNAKTEKFVISF